MSEIPYDEFGRRFMAHAVTEERILHGFGGLAGEPIAFGPIGAGPGKLAKVKADGQVGATSVRRTGEEPITFALTIPVGLDLELALGVDRHRFHAELEVALTLRARTADFLRIVIEVEPPRTADVTVDLKADGLRAEALRRVAGIDREIARFVARYIGRELEKPHVRAARDIDVAARIDGAWRTDA